MMRAVVDTNFFIASIFWNGAPYRLTQLALNNQFEIITSPEILTEVRTVLKRDFKLSEQEIDDILNCIMMYVKIIEPRTKVQVVRDSKDDMVLNVALDATAEYIITRDKDLLDIKTYQKIKIITPEEFWRLQ